MRLLDGTLLGTETFGLLNVGGGGFVLGMTMTKATAVAHPTYAVWGDTVGVWVKRPGDKTWQEVLLSNILPEADYAPGPINIGYWGGYCATVAPSDGTKGYFVTNGCIFRVRDNWTKADRVALAPKKAYPNGIPASFGSRLWNHKQAVDPFNPDIVITGFQGVDGTYVTKDGYRSDITKITIPNPADLSESGVDRWCPTLVAFDPSSVVGNECQTCYVFSRGVGQGLYRSTTGVYGPYTKVTGTPETCRQLVVTDAGVVYVVTENTTNQIRKYESGAWSTEDTLIANPTEWQSIAIDPAEPRRKMVISLNGLITYTIPDGGNFVWQPNGGVFPGYPEPKNKVLEAEEGSAPWMLGTDKAFFPSMVAFDTAAPGQVFMIQGIGVLRGALPTTWTNMTWYEQSAGIEQLVGNQAEYSDKGYVLANWDKWTFRINNPDKFPTVTDHAPPGLGLSAAWDVDFDGLVGYANISWSDPGHYRIHKTADGGRTWTECAAHPDGPFLGGCVAGDDAGRIIHVPGNNGRPVGSIDGGVTWGAIDLGGLLPAPGQENGFLYDSQAVKRVAEVSKNTPGTCWLINYGPTAVPALGGIWRSTTGPLGPWTKISGPPLGTGWNGWVKLQEVPGKAGWLLLVPHGDFNNPIAMSKDGGVTWFAPTPIMDGVPTTFRNVNNLGFAKNLDAVDGTPADVPAIRWHGYNPEGVYESLDGMETARFVTKYPANHLGEFKSILGRMDKFGDWIYGYSGSGWRHSKQRHRLMLT